jgi:hypothetical protein
MDQFMQMEIFFFIASVAAIVALLFVVVVGLYVFLIVRKTHSIIHEARLFAQFASSQGKDSLEMIKNKIEDILSRGGATERVIATALGTILAKTFKGRAKMKPEAPKKKSRFNK